MLRYIVLFWISIVYATPQYYCTASNDRYYCFVLNLIGSIHANNFENLETIYVYDLGLKSHQREQLKRIQKVSVCSLKDQRKELYTNYQPEGARSALGWYAWKPIVIHETLKKAPYVLWLDAGSLVLKNLEGLFRHIIKNGYFLCAYENTSMENTLHYRLTDFVREKFQLDESENQWMCAKGFLNGGIIGVHAHVQGTFLNEWFGYTKDLRFFADDGTSLYGARHDLTLLSLIAYQNQLKIYEQDMEQKIPLAIEGRQNDSFFITWNWKTLNEYTSIYSSRGDFRKLLYHFSQIRWK